jgi:hypothetical protein
MNDDETKQALTWMIDRLDRILEVANGIASDLRAMRGAPPSMSPERARELSRTYQQFAAAMRDQGAIGEAEIAERNSEWWALYAKRADGTV